MTEIPQINKLPAVAGELRESLSNKLEVVGTLVERLRNRRSHQALEIERWKIAQAREWAEKQRVPGLVDVFVILLQKRGDENKNGMSDWLELTEMYLKAQASLSAIGRVKAALQGQGVESSPAALQNRMDTIESKFEADADQIALQLKEQLGLSDEQLAEVKRISSTVVPIPPTMLERTQQVMESAKLNLGRIADRFVQAAEAGLMGPTQIDSKASALDIPAIQSRIVAQTSGVSSIPDDLKARYSSILNF